MDRRSGVVSRMSASGHERRPSQWTAASRFPLSPDSDRGRVALQYVGKGQKPTLQTDNLHD